MNEQRRLDEKMEADRYRCGERQQEERQYDEMMNTPLTDEEHAMIEQNVMQATIDTQAAEIARLRDEARWIPTAERMPDKHALVLVYRNGTRVGFIGSRGRMVDDRWIADYDNPVTHWRALPAPPEVQL